MHDTLKHLHTGRRGRGTTIGGEELLLATGALIESAAS